MTPELDAAADPIEELAEMLFRLAGDQNVRVMEALAATLINRRESNGGVAVGGLEEKGKTAPRGLEEPSASFIGAATERLQLCRRIARRALHGSLCDPTHGATAFHRIETTPAWTRHHLPVAVFGPFLFYRR